MKKESESRTMFLPVELYDRIEERAKATGFGTVEEYVIFVLGEVLKEGGEGEQGLSAEDEKEVKKRLKTLGYLD